jgi:hypothetical protein
LISAIASSGFRFFAPVRVQFTIVWHPGEVVSVYLRNDDIEKLVEFLSRKGN